MWYTLHLNESLSFRDRVKMINHEWYSVFILFIVFSFVLFLITVWNRYRLRANRQKIIVSSLIFGKIKYLSVGKMYPFFIIFLNRVHALNNLKMHDFYKCFCISLVLDTTTVLSFTLFILFVLNALNSINYIFFTNKH